MQTRKLNRPSVIIHCDWGSTDKKRWLAKATQDKDGYTAHAPEPIGELQELIPSIRQSLRENESALVGFDFPIGLPAHYGQKANISSFTSFLPCLGSQEWSNFFKVCDTKGEIRLERPFYPNRPGNTRKEHLWKALGLANQDQLLRRCEVQEEHRGAACSIFWTLGGNQVGKSAILGWKEVLQPAIGKQEIALWPFDGTLADLIKPGAIIAAETYPTQYHQRLFERPFQGKRYRSKRKQVGEIWIQRSNEWNITLADELRDQIQRGFPGNGVPRELGLPEKPDNNDDAFDAAIGLFGMIEAVQNYNQKLEPEDSTIRNIEGWIFGQPCC